MTKNCEQCGTAFQRPADYSANQWASRRFCGAICSSLNHRTGASRICLECGQPFYSPPNGKWTFCSLACRRAAHDIDRRYAVDEASGCWLWSGASSQAPGYGTIWKEGRFSSAHVAMYREHIGEVPSGMEIDHLCRNRLCINPAHLEPVTRRENGLRSPRIVLAQAAFSCPAGHPWNDRNTYRDPNGIRRCRACAREKKVARISGGVTTDFRRQGARLISATPAPRKGFWLLRLVRSGPLVPAHLWYADHEPGVPENKLDRGRLSIYPIAEIGGVDADPIIIFDRLHHPATHWKYLFPISAANYNFEVARFTWARRTQGTNPRRRLDPAQLPLPDFFRENNL